MSLLDIACRMAAEAPCLLFVYGTLMHTEEAHDKLASAIFLGEIKTAPQYSLMDLGDEFFAITSGGEQVAGELYAVDAATMAAVDDWEYDIYQRQPILLEDGRTAFAYVV
jgi:gamma-glutamylcyclotransferase (GGCT)/AIG2-like uncharacterized protein YtfP